jgi:hypothetical protein
LIAILVHVGPEYRMTFNIDADIRNADWAKRTFDIYTPDGTLVSTLDELRLAMPDHTDAQLKHMLDLPVGENMPATLKTELQAL